MNILEQLTLRMTQGMGLGLEQGTDVIGAMAEGRKRRESQQNMQVKSLEMQEFADNQKIKRDSKDVMGQADLSTIEGTRSTSEEVFATGDKRLGMELLKSANLQQDRADRLTQANEKLKGKGFNLKSPEGKKFGDILTIIKSMPEGEARNNMLTVLNNSIAQKQQSDQSKATDKMSKTADDIASSSLGLNIDNVDSEHFNLLASTSNTLLQSGKNIHQSRSHITKYYEEDKEIWGKNKIGLKSEWKDKVDVLIDPKTGRSFYADGNTFVGWVD